MMPPPVCRFPFSVFRLCYGAFDFDFAFHGKRETVNGLYPLPMLKIAPKAGGK